MTFSGGFLLKHAFCSRTIEQECHSLLLRISLLLYLIPHYMLCSVCCTVVWRHVPLSHLPAHANLWVELQCYIFAAELDLAFSHSHLYTPAFSPLMSAYTLSWPWQWRGKAKGEISHISWRWRKEGGCLRKGLLTFSWSLHKCFFFIILVFFRRLSRTCLLI